MAIGYAVALAGVMYSKDRCADLIMLQGVQIWRNGGMTKLSSGNPRSSISA